MKVRRPDEFNLILRTDFAAFAGRCFIHLNPAELYRPNWHVDVIAEALEKVRRGEVTRLIINMPPRHLKSTIVSIAFTAWMMGHDPSTQIINVTYGQDLSSKLARDVREIMASDWYQQLFPETRLSASKQSVSEFETTVRGSRLATSTDGVLTGRGANLIILDDPLKPEEAMSETQCNNVNAWYDNTLYSRLNDKTTGAIIIVMQRLHEDDLVGHVADKEPWAVVSLAAIAEEEKVYDIVTPRWVERYVRKAGEALHAEREPLTTLERIRATIGTFNFTCQYQQSPMPVGGALVKLDWLRSYAPEELPGSYEQMIQSWDTATRASEAADYSVCLTIGVKKGRHYLLHVFRRKLEYPDLKRAVANLAATYKPTTILIEDMSSGRQLAQELRDEGVGNVIAVMPEGDKFMRLMAQTPAIEAGVLYLPREASWRSDYVHELTGFPGSKHDDQVDATSQALKWLATPMPGIGIYRHMQQQYEALHGVEEEED